MARLSMWLFWVFWVTCVFIHAFISHSCGIYFIIFNVDSDASSAKEDEKREGVVSTKKKKKKGEKKRKKKKKHKTKSERYSSSSVSDSETIYPSDLKREQEADG